MTRMMLTRSTSLSHRRGERNISGSPWVMTDRGPLGSHCRRWLLNLPEVITDLVPLGPVRFLPLLEPVVGAATTRVTGGAAHLDAATEEMLIGVAVAIAVAGIVFAMVRLKPQRVPRKRDAVPEFGFEGLVANKYYVDEAIDRTIVTPTYAVSRNFSGARSTTA